MMQFLMWDWFQSPHRPPKMTYFDTQRTGDRAGHLVFRESFTEPADRQTAAPRLRLRKCNGCRNPVARFNVHDTNKKSLFLFCICSICSLIHGTGRLNVERVIDSEACGCIPGESCSGEPWGLYVIPPMDGSKSRRSAFH